MARQASAGKDCWYVRREVRTGDTVELLVAMAFPDETDYRDLLKRVSNNEKLLAVIPVRLENMDEKLKEIKKDCGKTRTWVEDEIEKQKKSEDEEKQLTATQKAAVTTGVFLVGATILADIATLLKAHP